MRVRPFDIALVFILMCGAGWCQCPTAAVPPGAMQSGHEAATRAVPIVVRELHLVNLVHATVDEQNKVAASLVGFCFPENKNELIGDRVRERFQNLGFFKARASVVAIEEVDDSVRPPAVSVIVRVEEGERYRLKEIAIMGNKAITNTSALRRLFPLKDGDVFDREMIHRGLDNLRYAYTQVGYVNLTAVPDTQIDDAGKLITLTVDVTEGAQFYVRSFSIIGADPRREAALRELWLQWAQPGSIYNVRLLQVFFSAARQFLPFGASPAGNLLVIPHSREHTVDIVLNAGPKAPWSVQ